MNVFVIMPIDGEFDTVYRALIKTPLESAGYSVSRANDPEGGRIVHQNIYDQIIQNLWDVDYILANLTNFKPNVVYELGIAHTLNKRTIQISQNLDGKLPFDIKSQNVISYKRDDDRRSELSAQVLEVLRLSDAGQYMFSNIIDDFVRRSSRKIVTEPPART